MTFLPRTLCVPAAGFLALLPLALAGCPGPQPFTDAGAVPDAIDPTRDVILSGDTPATSGDTATQPGDTAPLSDARSPACGVTSDPGDTLMFHRDRARLGWNPVEITLTPAAVASPRFGLLWNSQALDTVTIGGRSYTPHIFAMPLFAANQCVAGGTYDGLALDLVFTATSNAYVYAINATAATAGGQEVAAGTIVWRTRLGQAGVVPSLDGGVPMGVMSTPIIDRSASPPRLYVTSMDATAGWQAFALDLRSGRVLQGWPVTIDNASVGAVNRNGPAHFEDARVLSQRGALNLSPRGDVLYVPFGAYYDGGVGWMVAIDTVHPRLAAAFSGAPSVVASANGGIWGPGGPGIDADGRVYATSGNSPADSHDAPHVWGQSLLRWDPLLQLTGTFTPFNYCQMDGADTDLGGSSPVLLPELDPGTTSTPRLLAFGGKQGSVYLLDRDAVSGRTDHRPACSTDSTTDPSLLPPTSQPQFSARGPLNVFGPYSEEYGNFDRAKMRTTPAYFRDAAGRHLLFVSGASKAAVDSEASVPPCLARLRVVTEPGVAAYLAVDRYETTVTFRNPGSPVVTSNGAANAVVWVFDQNAGRRASLLDPVGPHPLLYAFDATTMDVLWHSATNELAIGGKYSTVTVARGMVFIGTDRIQAFGLRSR